MANDPERHARILRSLRGSGAEAYVCVSPSNVLLLTGYWPVLGNSVAIVSASGEAAVIVPEDELEIAQATTSARIVAYQPASMQQPTSAVQQLTTQLSQVIGESGLGNAVIAHETRYGMHPATYVSSAGFANDLGAMLRTAAPGGSFQGCDTALDSLGATKTPVELERMRTACRIAEHAFAKATSTVRPGATEPEIASAFQSAFDTAKPAASVQRSYGRFFCMSGPNSATASAAYARTRQRRIESGDLVMIHANTCADGYWTDITRTYIAGEPTSRQAAMRSAIEEARTAALAAVRPGATGDAIDRAAREVMVRHGLGEAFRHGTGHGVGFAAIWGGALPRIHPAYSDPIEEGSTFNIEPAAYFDGYGGMRHCDVVAATAAGAEILTSF